MKSKNFTLILAVLFTYSLTAQVIYQDDFEDFEVGQKVAQSDPGNWATWSGVTGGAEDPVISDAQAASGTKSLNITGTNDAVVYLDQIPLTTGRYSISMKMFVANGSYAYWNVLQEFAGANSIWGTQFYYRANGNTTLDAGGAEAATFNQPTGEWFDMTVIVDIEDDFSTLYHLFDELVSYEWSGGAFGSNTAQTIHAINFYAWDVEGTPNFFIDDILVEKVNRPGEAVDLTAQVVNGNQVQLDWNEAMGSDKYNVVNQGDVMAIVTDNTFLIEQAYPQAYEFQVGAHFPKAGYIFSNVEELELEGGQQRDYVIWEGGTGTWCVNCPAAARGLDQLHETGEAVGIIEYHNGDPFVTDDGTQRLAYYGIQAYPTTNYDGEIGVLGGSLNGNLYPTFKNLHDDRMKINALYSVDMDITTDGDGNYTISVNTDELYEYFEGDIKLQVVLTESNVPEVWFNLDELDFINREMFPNADGTSMDYGMGAVNSEFTFTLDPEYLVENCEVVAFLQHESSKEILNGDVFVLENALVVAVNEELASSITVGPNPTQNEITITGLTTDAAATMIAQDGSLVKAFNINTASHTEDISQLGAGTYVIKLTTDAGFATKTIIKL